MTTTAIQRKLLGITTAAAFMMGAGTVAQGANVFFSTAGSWSTASNWTSGTNPWDVPTAPGDDLFVQQNITVDSTETYTTGPNNGSAFQFRRVGMNGTKTMTIVDGGTFDFGGGSDGRILLSNSGNQLLMSGGTLQSDSGNLDGINISGSGALFEIAGSSTVNIFDPGAASQGVRFTGSSAKGMTVIGSSATISLEQIEMDSGASNIDLTFQFDSGGASQVSVTDAIAWDNTTSGLDLNLNNP